jgi:hypothetical protein
MGADIQASRGSPTAAYSQPEQPNFESAIISATYDVRPRSWGNIITAQSGSTETVTILAPENKRRGTLTRPPGGGTHAAPTAYGRRRPLTLLRRGVPSGALWGRSSAGRAPRSQCGGQGFDPPRLHFKLNVVLALIRGDAMNASGRASRRADGCSGSANKAKPPGAHPIDCRICRKPHWPEAV